MNISFFLTQQQIRDKTKTVTRRNGWRGMVNKLACGKSVILQPVVKGQGIKQGEHVQLIAGKILVKSARLEPLNAITQDDCRREGFPEMTPEQFVAMYCKHNKCWPITEVTRIEFIYL